MSVELSESVINGRFKYLDKPAALPGKCAVCGAVDKPVIDFGLDVDYFGAVVICTECMKTANQVVELYEGTATAPVVPPLNFLDVEAVNEYVARANTGLAALNSILANYMAHRQMDDESAEESSGVSDETERATEQDVESDDSVSISQGPSSVSASSRSESDDNVFDL